MAEIGIRLRWTFPLGGGGPPSTDALLIEDGFYILLESGDKLLL
jgi:hypothetical protein